MPPSEALEFGAGFLVKYGFIGVALLFLAIAWFTRSGSVMFATIVATLGVAFLVLYGALNFSLAYFPGLVIRPGTFLTGELAGVPTAVRIRMRAESQQTRPPYVRIENDPDDDGMQRHQFVFAYDQMFSCFTIYVSYPPSEERQENEYSFNIGEIPETQIRLGSKLLLAMKGVERDAKITLEQSDGSGRSTIRREVGPLETSNPPGRACGRATPLRRTALLHQFYRFDFLISSARAQATSTPDLDSFRRRLTSEDPVIRRTAREDLAEYGAKALSVLQQFLASDNYRLQLGATEAINRMQLNERNSVLAAVGPRIEHLQKSRDRTLAESARMAGSPPTR